MTLGSYNISVLMLNTKPASVNVSCCLSLCSTCTPFCKGHVALLGEAIPDTYTGVTELCLETSLQGRPSKQTQIGPWCGPQKETGLTCDYKRCQTLFS